MTWVGECRVDEEILNYMLTSLAHGQVGSNINCPK